MTVLRNLKKLKTSADFAGGIDSLETERTAALAAVATLEAKREDTLFEGRNLDRLEADIAAAGGKVKTLDIALTGARRRHTEATKAERMAGLEALGKRAVKLNGELRSAMIGFGDTASTLAGHAGQIKNLRHKLRVMKAEFVSGGMSDLGPVDPINEVAGLAGRQVRDPLAGLHVAEFIPAHPDGAALALLKK